MNHTDFCDVPDELWERIEPLLAPFRRTKSGGSQPLPQRTILAGILYKYRSRCQWRKLPSCYGSKSTVHEHFQRWNKAGIMTEIFHIFSVECGEESGLEAQCHILPHVPACSNTSSSEDTDRRPCNRGEAAPASLSAVSSNTENTCRRVA